MRQVSNQKHAKRPHPFFKNPDAYEEWSCESDFSGDEDSGLVHGAVGSNKINDDEREDLEKKLKKKNKDFIVELLIGNQELRSKLGIEELSEYEISVKEEGCIDGAILKHKTDPLKTVFIKLSTSTIINELGQEEEKEFGRNLHIDSFLLSILKELRCKVPDSRIALYKTSNGSDSYIMASKTIYPSYCNLKSVFYRDDVEEAESLLINHKEFLKTALLLFLTNAQDLNLDNLLLSSDKCIYCVDASFEDFYDESYIAIRDPDAKQYRQLNYDSLKNPSGDVISRLLGFQLKIDDRYNANSKIGLLLTCLFYSNQLSKDMKYAVTPNEKRGHVAFHPMFQYILFKNSEVDFEKVVQEVKESIIDSFTKRDTQKDREEVKILEFMSERLELFKKLYEKVLHSHPKSPGSPTSVADVPENSNNVQAFLPEPALGAVAR